MNTRLLVLLAMCAIASTAAAQVYRWVDKDGKVHYGDQPPPDAQTERVKVPAGPAPVEETTAGTAEESAAPTERPPATVREKTLKQKECELAKAALAAYESADYLQDRGADGQLRRLSESEKRKVIEDARRQVKERCEGAN